MPVSVSAVRACLVADANNHALPSPQPVDLDTEVIPYGATVRFEVETSEPLHPLWAYVRGATGAHQFLFPKGGGNIYSAEVRIPGDLFGGEILGLTRPPVFPADAPNWPQGEIGGEYVFTFIPWALGTVSEASPPASFTKSFRIAHQPSAGGGKPKIVKLDTGANQGKVRLGQPWLFTAQVEDPDDDVLAVVFGGTQGGLCRWFVMRDDGRYGDQVPRDRVYSFLRVGGDWWDRPEVGLGEDAPVTLTVQAVDLRGNWSDPVHFAYQLAYSQPPVWMEQPDPGGPNIVDGGVSREKGPFTHPLLWAKCDSPEVWVCVRQLMRPDMTCALYDDGKGPDAKAGDGIHSTAVWLPSERITEVVYYAVPRSGPLKVGEKLAAECPALVTG